MNNYTKNSQNRTYNHKFDMIVSSGRLGDYHAHVETNISGMGRVAYSKDYNSKEKTTLPINVSGHGLNKAKKIIAREVISDLEFKTEASKPKIQTPTKEQKRKQRSGNRSSYRH